MNSIDLNTSIESSKEGNTNEIYILDNNLNRSKVIYDKVTASLCEEQKSAFDLKYRPENDEFFNDLINSKLSFRQKISPLNNESDHLFQMQGEQDFKFKNFEYLNSLLDSKNELLKFNYIKMMMNNKKGYF